MVYILAGITSLIVILFVLFIELSQRLGYLKSRCDSDREYNDKCFSQQIARYKINENSIAELNRVLFVTVESPDSRNFQEKVSLGTILGSVMSELGLSMQCKALKITKKGENNVKRTSESEELVRGSSTKEKS